MTLACFKGEKIEESPFITMAHRNNNKFSGRAGDRGQARPYNDHRRDHDQPYRSSNSNAMNELGDFVARRLVPEMQRSSDRPIHLVMNFGTLFVPDPYEHSDLTNAVVYNAPGSTMVLGSGSSGSSSSSLSRFRSTAHSSDIYSGVCPGCLSRKLLWPDKYCRDCENDLRGLREPRWLREVEPSYGRVPYRTVFPTRFEGGRTQNTFR